MKTLVIAEKPSVAQDIVRALTPVAGKFDKHDDHFENDSYVVTSAVGHLVEIQAPEQYDVKRGKWSFANLPVIPPHFDLKPVDKTKSRLSAVVKQAKRKDVTQLVNACDAGREGELIFRLIEQYAGGAKPLGKPVKRLWLQSMTPQAIRDGFDALRTEKQMQGLADAARSRSEADWLVGINGTRAFTAFNSRDGGFFLTTVGRVQTPTLSVVVEREEQIRKFISRDYWEIHANFQVSAGEYAGKWINPKHQKDENDAEKKADRTLLCLLLAGCNIPGMEDVEDVIVSSGPNTWPNWRNFSDRIIQPGDIVFMDLAALTWNGYKSCYYRTYCVGKEPTKEQKDTYATALEWLYDSIHAVKAGTTTREIAKKWPSAKEAWGYKEEDQAAGHRRHAHGLPYTTPARGSGKAGRALRRGRFTGSDVAAHPRPGGSGHGGGGGEQHHEQDAKAG